MFLRDEESAWFMLHIQEILDKLRNKRVSSLYKAELCYFTKLAAHICFFDKARNKKIIIIILYKYGNFWCALYQNIIE